ncbi:MAG: diacylglycerol kinase, partial [Actinomyces sp.]|nr:diacylglycerol kinase [Actinomyces sp.]
MDATPWVLAAVAGAGAIGVARLTTALTRRHRRRQALAVPASVDDPTRGRPRPWIIMNPSKHEDPQAFKDLINRKAKELG